MVHGAWCLLGCVSTWSHSGVRAAIYAMSMVKRVGSIEFGGLILVDQLCLYARQGVLMKIRHQTEF